jgi:sugar phosphate isomerase/epimerase
MAALAASATALGVRVSSGETPATSDRPIIGFSKPFQSLGAEDTAAFVEQVGWSGIECPVRAMGQIEPQRVETELPRFTEAFQRRGLTIPLLVTDIASIGEPHAEKVLRTAAQLGVKRIRLGTFRYRFDRPIEGQVEDFGKALKDIGAACGELGIRAGVQNHSGRDRFCAPVWDLMAALGGSHAQNVGICFDIAHATIEGGLSWPIQVHLAEPHFLSVYFKDFVWVKEKGSWIPGWCPLGDGMVERSFAAGLARSAFSGPICQHHEYPLGGRAEMLAHMQHDLRVLKEWLA